MTWKFWKCQECARCEKYKNQVEKYERELEFVSKFFVHKKYHDRIIDRLNEEIDFYKKLVNELYTELERLSKK